MGQIVDDCDMDRLPSRNQHCFSTVDSSNLQRRTDGKSSEEETSGSTTTCFSHRPRTLPALACQGFPATASAFARSNLNGDENPGSIGTPARGREILLPLAWFQAVGPIDHKEKMKPLPAGHNQPPATSPLRSTNSRNRDASDQNAGHAAQRRRTCDQLSPSTAPCRSKQRAPPPASSHSGARGGFEVRGRRKIARMMQSTCCRNPRAMTGVAARMLRRCLGPDRASGSERRWLERNALAASRGGCGREFLPGETRRSGYRARQATRKRKRVGDERL